MDDAPGRWALVVRRHRRMHANPGSGRPRPIGRIAGAGSIILVALSLVLPLTAVAVDAPLTISTTYPSITVAPGTNPTFPITLRSTELREVKLALSGVPDGWTATLRGGSQAVDTVTVDPKAEQPPDLKLELKIPDSATGTSRIVLRASSSDGASDSLELTVTVSAPTGGDVTMTSDFPVKKGRSDQTFSFSLSLKNDTGQPITFTLTAVGPDGWKVDATWSRDPQAASLQVEAGSESTVSVSVTPDTQAATGQYPIKVAAAGGGYNPITDLGVEITGNVEIQMTTPDQRLSTNATAGQGKAFTVLVVNRGTSPANNVTLASTPPTGWKVTFSPEKVDTIAPNSSATVTATLTPPNEAVAGDYVITMRASTPESNDSIDVRVTVETSQLWAFVGIAIIVVVLAGLFLVFRRYGRR